MSNNTSNLLAEIEAFLAETGMGESYFGKRAVGNSELVSRLRAERRVWPETVTKARSFMKKRRMDIRDGGHGTKAAAHQEASR